MSKRFTMNDLKAKNIHVSPDGKGKRLPLVTHIKSVSKKDIEKLEKELAANKGHKTDKSGKCLKGKISVKPLSVNKLFQGRRFRTPEYDKYEKSVINLLPAINTPKPPYSATFTFGFSNKASDVDNCLKGAVDILQKHYRFNDKDIYEIHAYKKIVAKGQEYFEFEIKSI